jgi:hypothetical protein
MAVSVGINSMLCLAAWAQAPGERIGTGSIEGRVLLSSGQPGAGMEIHVYSEAPVPPVKTGSGGTFRFDRLPAGRYGLTLHPMSGYRSRDAGIVLRDGEKVSGIELRALEAASVSGHVRDAKGRPAAGLLVSAIRLHGGGSRHPPDRGMAGPTNDLGEFNLTGLNPGLYTLLVETRRLAVKPRQGDEERQSELPGPVQAETPTYYPNAASLELAAPFALEFGQKLEGLDITLSRQATLCVRSRNAVATQVRVEVAAGYYLGATRVAEGTVGAGASFELCGLAPGAYTLLASPLDEQDPRYASERFTLTKTSVRLGDVTLQPLVPLAGRVALDPATETRTLPASLSISLMEIGRPYLPNERRTARVTETGPFVFPALLADEYWLTVRPPAGYYVKSATAGAKDAMHEPIHSASGELLVVLGGDGAKLSVTGTDKASNPVPFCNAIVARDPLPANPSRQDLAGVACDQNGVATITALPPGRYKVLVVADAFLDPANTAALFQAHQAKAEALQLDARESRTLSLRAADRVAKD